MRHLVSSLVLLCCLYSTLAISCLDNYGNPVDWWIAYKLPKISGSTKNVENGVAFYYMDSKTPRFSLSPSSMNDTSGTAMSNTLNQIYLSGAGTLMWSDQPPVGSDNSARAHAKGVMGFDASGGFFLRHSIPRYPPVSEYYYPNTGTIYGQNLLCMSMDLTSLNIVAEQFQINNPQIYNVKIPPGVFSKNILALSRGEINQSDLVSSRNIKLRSGLMVTDFAKQSKWNKDLWDDEIAVTLHSGMKVETWGRPLQPNSCSSTFHVENVEVVGFTSSISFKETKDHSKWGVSGNGYTCIGDINRMTSQRKRGGGATCFSLKSIFDQYTSIISTFTKC